MLALDASELDRLTAAEPEDVPNHLLTDFKIASNSATFHSLIICGVFYKLCRIIFILTKKFLNKQLIQNAKNEEQPSPLTILVLLQMVLIASVKCQNDKKNSTFVTSLARPSQHQTTARPTRCVCPRQWALHSAPGQP